MRASAPVIWLDALDLPLFVALEGSYAEEADFQAQRNRPDTSQVEFAAAGMLPTRRRGDEKLSAPPMMRFSLGARAVGPAAACRA